MTAGAGAHALGRGVVDERPDLAAAHGRVNPAPGAARVVGAQQALIGARVDDLRLPRIRREAAHDAVRMHALRDADPAPRLARVGAAHDALAHGAHEDGGVAAAHVLLPARDLAANGLIRETSRRVGDPMP